MYGVVWRITRVKYITVVNNDYDKNGWCVGSRWTLVILPIYSVAVVASRYM